MTIEDVIENNDKVENLRAFERRRLIGLNGSRGSFASRLKIPNQIYTADITFLSCIRVHDSKLSEINAV